jgi:GrpB-like predicted nucleotidyltransferase (UPF0157 family)
MKRAQETALSMPIIIVPYDPAWPGLYEEEKRLVLEAVGDKIISLDHIGSTSVPHLSAKPVIDIIAGVVDKMTADKIIEAMLPQRYTHISPSDNPDWFYCICRAGKGVRFHLHLVRYGSQFHQKHILFRDWLRTHPDDARKYYELKLDLAKKYRHDTIAYADAKTDFINCIVEKAKKKGKS